MPANYQLETSDVGVYVPVEAVFPGLTADEPTLLTLLQSLSRDDTLIVAARINISVTGFGLRPPFQRQQSACAQICSLDELHKIDAFAAAHGGAGKATVFFRGQLLELTRWVARHCKNLPGDGATFDALDVRRRFLQVALIAGALWGKRIYADRLSSDGNVEAIRERALGAFRKGVEESGVAPHAGIALGRGWLMFSEYLPRRYPAFNQEFHAATNLSVEQYFVCVAALSEYTLAEKTGGSIFRTNHVGHATAYRSIFPAYLALESQEVAGLGEALWRNFDSLRYRSIRERPILNLSAERSIILDPTFFSERLTVGPLFHLISPITGRKANEIFGAFGLAFEDYANDILKRMYPDSPFLVKRLSCNVPGRSADGREFEIDAILNDATDVIIFEMKAAWLREDKILGESEEIFVNHIRSKYGGVINASERSGEREKGVAQLARIVGAIARRQWLGQGNEFASVRTIYPVLVVHDARLSVPGLGNFLDREFRALLGDDAFGVRIAPLTIMTIDDLENLESSVGKFTLTGLLGDYTLHFPDRIRTLHNFMAFTGYAEKINPPASVRDKSDELMKLVKASLRPTSISG